MEQVMEQLLREVKQRREVEGLSDIENAVDELSIIADCLVTIAMTLVKAMDTE